MSCDLIAIAVEVALLLRAAGEIATAVGCTAALPHETWRTSPQCPGRRSTEQIVLKDGAVQELVSKTDQHVVPAPGRSAPNQGGAREEAPASMRPRSEAP